MGSTDIDQPPFMHSYGRGAVVPLAIALLLLIPFGRVASANPITLTVNPGLVGPTFEGARDLDFSFGSQLDGVTLSGQSMSLDFVFADGILARVSSSVEGTLDLGVLLEVQTTANGFPGFAGPDTMGFALAPDGTPLQPPQSTGRGAGSDGTFFAGIFPTLAVTNFEMSGVHFDIVFPSTGYMVTGGKIRVSSVDDLQSIRFGTAAQLPEPATLALLLVGVLCACVGRRSRLI